MINTVTRNSSTHAVYWKLPYGWFGDEVITIDLGEDSTGAEEDDVVAPEGRTVARREVPSPLRRWAAGRVVRHDPGAWAPLFTRARDLDARNGAAIAAGLLDAIEELNPSVQALVIKEGTQWPDQAVRRLALVLVADRDGRDTAYRLAKDDPSARVRPELKPS